MNIRYFGNREETFDGMRLAVISYNDSEQRIADMMLSHFNADGINATMEDEIHIQVTDREDYEYMVGKYKEYKKIINDTFIGFMEYISEKIVGAPKSVVTKTAKYMFFDLLGLSDAFREAARECNNPSKRLNDAFMTDDFREFIPSSYRDEYLDFEKFPLKYVKSS